MPLCNAILSKALPSNPLAPVTSTFIKYALWRENLAPYAPLLQLVIKVSGLNNALRSLMFASGVWSKLSIYFSRTMTLVKPGYFLHVISLREHKRWRALAANASTFHLVVRAWVFHNHLTKQLSFPRMSLYVQRSYGHTLAHLNTIVLIMNFWSGEGHHGFA